MTDQEQPQETPEQKKARLDQWMPTSDPRHQSHSQHLARQRQMGPAHDLMLQILEQAKQQDQQGSQQPTPPASSVQP